MTVCARCAITEHEKCTGCIRCGCVISAQYAHHTPGKHRSKVRP